MNKKKRLGLIAIIILSPVLINYLLFSWRAPKVTGSLDSWIGFIGNYSGGIIGAFVALLAAKVQIDGQKRESFIQRRVEQLPTLIKIKKEIEVIENNLQFLERKGRLENMQQPSEQAKEVEKIMLIQGMLMEPRYNDLSLFLKELKEETWTGLEKVIDVNLQENIIENYSIHSKIINVLRTDLIRSEIRLEELDKIINNLKAKEDKSISEIEQLRAYQKESTELHWIVTFNLNDRHKIWDRLFSNDFFTESVRSLKDSINNEINIIRKINEDMS